MLDPAKLAAADQYAADSDKVLNDVVASIRTNLLAGSDSDRTQALLGVVMLLKQQRREQLEHLLAAALVRLASDAGLDQHD